MFRLLGGGSGEKKNAEGGREKCWQLKFSNGATGTEGASNIQCLYFSKSFMNEKHHFWKPFNVISESEFDQQK